MKEFFENFFHLIWWLGLVTTTILYDLALVVFKFNSRSHFYVIVKVCISHFIVRTLLSFRKLNLQQIFELWSLVDLLQSVQNGFLIVALCYFFRILNLPVRHRYTFKFCNRILLGDTSKLKLRIYDPLVYRRHIHLLDVNRFAFIIECYPRKKLVDVIFLLLLSAHL